MAISQAEVKELSEQLRSAIIIREKKLSSASASIIAVDKLTELFDHLRAVLNKGKQQIENEKKEIKEMKHKLDGLQSIKKIDPEDPRDEKSVLLFVEGQSIISDTESMKGSDDLESLNEKIKYILDQIKRLLNEKIEEHAPAKSSSAKRYAEENKVIQKEPSKEIVKDVPKEVHKEFPKDVPKDAPRNVAKPAFRPQSVHEQKAAVKSVGTGKIREVKKIGIIFQIGNDAVPLSAMNLAGQPPAETAHMLGIAKKTCDACGQLAKRVLVFKCQCAFCPECLKLKLIKGNDKLLYNTFEAIKKQETMCACPTHNFPINMNLLESIVGSKQLELFSIEALKRQRKKCKNKNIFKSIR